LGGEEYSPNPRYKVILRRKRGERYDWVNGRRTKMRVDRRLASCMDI
jgi:hypothetical protein